MGCKTPTSFKKMLDRDTPPEADEIIVVGVETLHDSDFREDYTLIHAPGCGEGDVQIEHTTGKALRRWLGRYYGALRCTYCLGENWMQTHLLLNVDEPDLDKESANGIVNINCVMLTFYETWKPGHVNEWCQWFCGKTPDQIREEARQELGWYSKTGGRQLACFGVYLGDRGSDWIVAGGDTVARRIERDVVLLHGLIPEHLGKNLGAEFTGVSVLVDEDFTLEHLQIAVGLYDLDLDGIFGGDEERKQAAERGVETAALALI